MNWNFKSPSLIHWHQAGEHAVSKSRILPKLQLNSHWTVPNPLRAWHVLFKWVEILTNWNWNPAVESFKWKNSDVYSFIVSNAKAWCYNESLCIFLYYVLICVYVVLCVVLSHVLCYISRLETGLVFIRPNCSYPYIPFSHCTNATQCLSAAIGCYGARLTLISKGSSCCYWMILCFVVFLYDYGWSRWITSTCFKCAKTFLQ